MAEAARAPAPVEAAPAPRRKRRPAASGALPSYVEACEASRWSLYLHHTKSGRRFAVPYRCGSWRHEGECAQHNSARIFARLSEQLGKVEPRHVLMLVLTFDQQELRRGAAMVDLGVALARAAGAPVEVAVDPRWLAFASLWRRWQSLRQALHRMADRLGVPRARWALTVESHRRGGWPHCHLVMHWPWLAEQLAETEHDCGRVHTPQDRCGARGCLRDWLSARAEACGFGRVLSLDVARSATKVASYIVKLSGEVERPVAAAAGGELAKMSQLPAVAPRGFRRLRYSLRSGELEPMLAPTPRDPHLTGALCAQPAAEVEAAIVAQLDLVDVTDANGEVHRVSFVLVPRAPPTAEAMERQREAAVLRHLEAVWWRLYGPGSQG